MRTKSLLVSSILAAALVAHVAQAQTAPPIERIGGRSVEIITASAKDSAQGLRVSGLVRRGKVLGRPPQSAHLDVTAFGADNRRLATTPTHLGQLTARRDHREPGRYTAVFPSLALQDVTRLEVRYQAQPHGAESGEAPR